MEPLTASLLVAGNTLLGGIAGGEQNRQGFKARQHQRDMAYAGLEQLDPSRIRNLYNEFSSMQAPFMNQMAASQMLAGQNAANSAQAGLSRAGLGSTGLGSALGAGLNAGAAFQTNALRARMQQDIMRSALGVASQRASTLAGTQLPVLPSMGTFGGALRGAGSALTALEPYIGQD